MEVSNGDVFGAKEALQKLGKEKFPVKTAYALAKLIAAMNEQLKVIETVRNGLVEKYGEKNGKNQMQVRQFIPNPNFKSGDKDCTEPSEVQNPNWPKFVAEFEELMQKKENIGGEKVKLPDKVSSTCDSCHHNMDRPFEIEAVDLMALSPFVEVG